MSSFYAFLVNPHAGGGRGAGAAVPVARALREAGNGVDVTYPASVEDVGRLAGAAAARGDIVVAVGGDGLVALAVGAVAAAHGVLGLVPAGRGNDFARALDLPTSAAERARVLMGAPRAIDLLSYTPPSLIGAAETHVVAGSVYAGVDAEAAFIVSRTRRVPHRLQYPLAAVRALSSYRPASIRLRVDDTEYHFRAATVIVANSPFYGGGMRIAPAALIDDGLLDIVVVEARSRVQLVRSLPRLYGGSHVDLPEVTVLRGRRIELAGDPVPVGGDGEPLGLLPAGPHGSAVIQVMPGALSVLAPAG